jgi:hypothetical protein
MYEITALDVYSASLLLISLTVFVVRYIRQDPPIMPYLIIACVCAVGNWLGEFNSIVTRWGATSLLVAASFLFLGCLMAPYRDKLRARRSSDSSSENAAQAS